MVFNHTVESKVVLKQGLNLDHKLLTDGKMASDLETRNVTHRDWVCGASCRKADSNWLNVSILFVTDCSLTIIMEDGNWSMHSVFL